MRRTTPSASASIVLRDESVCVRLHPSVGCPVPWEGVLVNLSLFFGAEIVTEI